jgi:hypothetical protein
MPRLTVSPAVDGTWVRVRRPDGSTEYFDTPLSLWRAIVGQPGRHACDAKALGLTPADVDPSCVRPEWVRARAWAQRVRANIASLPAEAVPSATELKAALNAGKPKKLRVPKWAQEKLPPPDAETACL